MTTNTLHGSAVSESFAHEVPFITECNFNFRRPYSPPVGNHVNFSFDVLWVSTSYLDAFNFLSTPSLPIEIENMLASPLVVTQITGEGTQLRVLRDDYTPATGDMIPMGGNRTYLVVKADSRVRDIQTTLAFTISYAEFSRVVSVVVSGEVPYGVITHAPGVDKYKERMLWASDVMQSFDGKEQRINLKSAPRYELEYPVTLQWEDRARFSNFLYGLVGSSFLAPLWADKMILVSSAHAGSSSLTLDTNSRAIHPGDKLLLILGPNHYTAVKVQSTTQSSHLQVTLQAPLLANWPENTPVYLLSNHYLGNYTQQQPYLPFTSTVLKLTTADHLQHIPAPTGVPTYRGHTVRESILNWDGNLEVKYDTLVDTIDNQTGGFSIYDIKGPTLNTQRRREFLHGQDKVWEFRRYVNSLKGRVTPFWVDSDSVDLELTGDVPANGVVLKVKRTGFVDNNVLTNCTDIAIKTHTLGVLYRKVTAATSYSESEDHITLDSALSDSIVRTADVRMISYMLLVRLDSDVVEITHYGEHLATAEYLVKGLRINV